MEEVAKLKEVGHQLIKLLGKARGFNLVSELSSGSVLLVGEGNLSFTLSLAGHASINPYKLIATIYEELSELSDDAVKNSEALQNLRADVIYDVDATKLYDTFGTVKFDNIVFNFPNVASREPIEDRNPNFILVRDFLISAANQLNHNAKVYINAVDTPHYRGAFSLEEAAEVAGFKMPEIYPFDPYEFSGYNHVMTHNDDSALESYDSFATWVFEL